MGDLRLLDYKPRSELRVRETAIARASLPVIDVHNHMQPWTESGRSLDELIALMDDLNIQTIVNLAGPFGDTPDEAYAGYERRCPERFVTFGWLDLSQLDRPDFETWTRMELSRQKELGLRGLKIWKALGLQWRDNRGLLIQPDDERLIPVWRTAAELGWPVLLHVADPVAFFKPIDEYNERYDELGIHPDWSFYGRDYPRFDELMEALERLLARESGTTFILAHVASYSENLQHVAHLLDRYPNANVDISARFAELGRQPYTARDFFLKYEDRILYGLDSYPVRESYRLSFRFMETMDEYFPYSPDGPPSQGRWHIYGIGLPQATLAKVYRDNARRLIPGLAR